MSPVHIVMSTLTFLVWVLYVAAHVIIWDWIDSLTSGRGTGKMHPGLGKLNNWLVYSTAFLVCVSWLTVIGLAISGLLGFLPAIPIYYITKHYSTRKKQ